VRNQDDRVVRVFGEEWARFPQSALSQADLDSMYADFFSVFPWELLDASAVGADFGCGSGRWAKYVAPRVKHLHLIDASAAALNVARANLRDTGNVSFHHHTLDEVTLPEQSLDFGYAIGVLHHIPDSKRALASVVRTLKPGAPLLVYLYYAFENRPAWFRAIWPITDVGRRIICRLPMRLRYTACDLIALTVYWPLARVARALDRLGWMPDAWPLSWYRNRSFYVMRTDALDRFGTSLEKRFSRPQIEAMLHEAGLTDVRFSPRPPYWCAVATKAEAPAPPAREQRTVQRRRRVLVLCPHPEGVAPGQRLKYEQYFDYLRANGYDITVSPFMSLPFWRIVYKKGHLLEKVLGTLRGYAKRVYDLGRIPFYDGTYIFLWVTPFGIPLFERAVRLVSRKMVYDIDDLVFIGRTSPVNRVVSLLKGKEKAFYLMQHADHVVTCTPHLDKIARQWTENTTDISSTIDTDAYVPAVRYNNDSVLTLGWSGSHSTSPYVHLLRDVLLELKQRIDFKILVIGDPDFRMEGIDVEALAWNRETEVRDLRRIDIGLYPLPDELWVQGKSGLKGLQYMALGIPTVATAVGANFRVIEHGVSGFLAHNDEEWVEFIMRLAEDPVLRREIGLHARARVEQLFSIKANRDTYLRIFDEVYRPAAAGVAR
jgi:glycosyltransferase involved in cell wall biosynthesis/SAM-dependent methyltransferase